jgi:hypothetical protein
MNSSSSAAGRRSKDLDEVRVREDVDQAAPCETAEGDEVAPPDLRDRQPGPYARLHVHRLPFEDVHRAEEVVPGIGREQLRHLGLPPGEVVELEAQLDRQPS